MSFIDKIEGLVHGPFGVKFVDADVLTALIAIARAASNPHLAFDKNSGKFKSALLSLVVANSGLERTIEKALKMKEKIL